MISRVVDGEFRIDEHARREYLRRVARVAPRARWCLLGFALMSNHIHWLLLCLGVPIRELAHPLHTGFGLWLNGRDKRSTPVFAGRPDTYLFEPEEALRLLAYIHNNPVRAQVERTAADSNWTSHRFYLGAEPAPSWLDVELGLELCGLSADATGRTRFDTVVNGVADEPRDPLYGADRMTRARRELRRQLNAPIELASPSMLGDEVQFPILGVEGMPVCERWDGPMAALVAEVARAVGVSRLEMLSRSRTRRIVRARRLVVLSAREYLGRTIAEASVAMGLSASAGSKLLSRASLGQLAELEELARGLSERLRLGTVMTNGQTTGHAGSDDDE